MAGWASLLSWRSWWVWAHSNKRSTRMGFVPSALSPAASHCVLSSATGNFAIADLVTLPPSWRSAGSDEAAEAVIQAAADLLSLF